MNQNLVSDPVVKASGSWLHVPNDVSGEILSYFIPPLIAELKFNTSVSSHRTEKPSPTGFDLWWLVEVARALDDGVTPQLDCSDGRSLRNAFDMLSSGAMSIDAVRRASSAFSNSKDPCALREGLYWVGGTMNDHMYLPPPASALPALISDFFLFGLRQDIGSAEKAIVAFTQFALIHPFRDGNGRLARLIACSFGFGRSSLGIASAMAVLLTFWRRDFFYAHQFAARNRYNLTRCKSLWMHAHNCAKQVTEDASIFYSELLVELEAIVPKLDMRRKIINRLWNQPRLSVPHFTKTLGASTPMSQNIMDALTRSGWLERSGNELLCPRVVESRRAIVGQLLSLKRV